MHPRTQTFTTFYADESMFSSGSKKENKRKPREDSTIHKIKNNSLVPDKKDEEK